MGEALSVESGSGHRGQRVIIKNPEIKGVKKDKTPKKVRVVLTSKSDEVTVGDYIELKAVLSPPSLPAMPFAANFARNAWFEQIGAVGYAVSRVRILNRKENLGLMFWIETLRSKVSKRVKNVLPNDSGAIAAALIAGDRGGVSKSLADSYRDSGLAHFLSISGLHMGLVGGTVFFITRLLFSFFPKIALPYDIKKGASAAAIVAITAYLIISGFRIPAQRAYIMSVTVFAAILLNKRATSMRSVAIAVILVLLWHSEALVLAGFQMSFAAVIGLIAAYEAFGKFFVDKKASGLKKIGLYILGIAFADFVASVSTLPFAVYHFNRIAVYTLLANVMAAPLIALVVMPSIVFALLLMVFSLEYPALIVAGWGINIINQITSKVSSMEGAVVTVKAMPLLSLLLITFGFLWLCLWQHKWRFWGFLFMFFGIVVHWQTPVPDLIVGNMGKTFAIIQKKEIELSSPRESFIERVWRERSGISQKNINNHIAKCDEAACVFEIKNKKISIVKRYEALYEDCLLVDVVISPFPTKNICKNPIVFDLWDFYKNGTHSFYIKDNNDIVVKTIKQTTGNRLWSRASF